MLDKRVIKGFNGTYNLLLYIGLISPTLTEGKGRVLFAAIGQKVAKNDAFRKVVPRRHVSPRFFYFHETYVSASVPFLSTPIVLVRRWPLTFLNMTTLHEILLGLHIFFSAVFDILIVLYFGFKLVSSSLEVSSLKSGCHEHATPFATASEVWPLK